MFYRETYPYYHMSTARAVAHMKLLERHKIKFSVAAGADKHFTPYVKPTTPDGGVNPDT